MSFYENFINICKDKNVPAGTVCKNCGLSESIHSKWKKSIPKIDIVIKLSEYFNVSTDYLLLGKEPSIAPEYKSLISSYKELSSDNKQLLNEIIKSMIDIQTANKKRTSIKYTTIKLMLNKASAGTGYGLNDAEYKKIQVVSTPEAEKADFAITVDGESMFPDYNNGEVVLVKKQNTIEIGQVGIFRINNSEGYIKEYAKNCLISRNPEFDNIIPKESDQVECIGLVLGVAELP